MLGKEIFQAFFVVKVSKIEDKDQIFILFLKLINQYFSTINI